VAHRCDHGAVAGADVADPRLEIIYAESVRKLDQQAGVVDGLRSRTGLLLSAGAVSTSFLGPQALRAHAGWAWPSIAALGSLLLASVLLVAVLWPRSRWVFSHDISLLLDYYVEGENPRTVNWLIRSMSVKNERFHDRNKRRLWWLFLGYQLAAVSLGASVVLWLLHLKGIGQ